MKKITIIMFLIIISFSFFGCTRDSINENDVQIQTIVLTTDNFEDYFFIQKETISWVESTYTRPSSPFTRNKIDVSTKLFILPLIPNIQYNNVVISFDFDSKNNKSGTPVSKYWNGDVGQLRISFDGNGFLVLTSYWDEVGLPSNTASYPTAPKTPTYIVKNISGSILIN